jgi:hypothetical protein
MRRLMIILGPWLATLALAAAAVPSNAAAPEPVDAAGHINVTADSAPGWRPSADQVRQAKAAAEDYLAAKDSGRYAEAYAMLAEGDRGLQPFAAFSADIQKFNAQAGAVRQRRIVEMTWTKDPAQAPLPGIYAALDLESTFARVDRHCGYVVLYQASAGQPFQVMREEANFLDNATADDIARRKSREEVDRMWAKLSANCPNYHPPSAIGQQGPLPEQPDADIGYPTVASALAALRAKPGVEISMVRGWTVIDDRAAATLWSFPPPSDPAYPAAVKRQVVQDGNASSLVMTIKCEASKPACDKLVLQFNQLNDALRERLQSKP